MQGWIKLHRQIVDSDFYFSERFTKSQAWIDLLLLANHKPATVFIRGIEIDLLPGQLCYSQLTLANRWRWNFKTVVTFLQQLQKRKMVETKTNNVTTIISIKNWNLYQGNGEQNGEQKETKTETDNNEENAKKKHMSIFDEAKKIYPGKKRGLQTEYDDFSKKHKDYSTVIHLLKPAIEKQINHRDYLIKRKEFVPAWKNFKTWINQRCWEEETNTEDITQPQLPLITSSDEGYL